MLFDFRAAAEHTHVIYHSGRPLHLGVNAFELVGQIVDLHIAVAQTLEHIDDGHAHHVQRLIDLVRQAGGHFAEGGHFCALRQLLLRAAHFGVVAAHCLHFEQTPVLIEHATIRPDPPRMLATGQAQIDFGGTHRQFRGQLRQALNKGFALFVRHPVAQIHPGQLLRGALQISRQRPVAEGQCQVRAVAANHRRRIFDQNPVALLAGLDLLGGEGRFGDVQPQAHRFDGQAEIVAQQFGFIEQPVRLTLTVEHPISSAYRAFTQQLASAFEIARTVFGVDVLHQSPISTVCEIPTEQGLQAGAEKRRLQRAFYVALHVNHRG